MIPGRKEISPVILDLLADGRDRSSDEIQEAVALHFELTEEERARMRGPHPEYKNETAWALVDLQAYGMIRKPASGELIYRLTDAGESARREGWVPPPRTRATTASTSSNVPGWLSRLRAATTNDSEGEFIEVRRGDLLELLRARDRLVRRTSDR